MSNSTGEPYIMKGKIYKRGLALMLGLVLAAQGTGLGFRPFREIFDSYAYTGAATVKASSLNVRSGAGTNYSSVGRLAAGASVNVIGEQRGTDGNVWYQIQYTGTGGAVNTGFVSSAYVRLPVSYSADSNFEAYLTSQGFPESYKNGLRQLHAQYPTWVFKAKNTGLDWNTVIENESLLGRNLVSSGSVSSWKSVADGAYNWDNSTWTGFDGSNWVAASEDIIRYYMDPRNFLDETYVFQFLSHEYNSATQTREGLSSMVAGTFLSGTTTSTGTGGSDFSAGPGDSSGRTSTKGPGKSSSYDDSQHGPGVSGSSGSSGSQSSGSYSVSLSGPSGTSSGSANGAGQGSPSGGSQGSTNGASQGGVSVSLEGPQASVTPRQHNFVAVSVSLTPPGADSSQSGPVGTAGTVTTGNAPGSSNTSAPGSPNGSGTNASVGSAPGGSGSSGTAGTVPAGSEATYIDILMNAAAQSGVSPYVLAAMILQEQSTDGSSPLISGNYSGYEGYYNFFNVEAYQSGSMSAIQMGLRYASQSGSYGRPWNTVEKSILGGAQNYGDNYVKAGQNTFYLKKFNVQGQNLYKHQYMSNVQGAASEAAKLAQAYTSSLKQSALEFEIPVYQNMPEASCVAPTGDGSPNNKLNSLGVDGFGLTPSFNRDTESYQLIVDSSVTQVYVTANPADGNASVSGTGNIALQNGTNDITISVTAKNGSIRYYTIHVVKQDGGPTAGSGGGVYTSQEGGPGGSNGPGASDSGASGPGGSNVTIVEIQP